MTQINRSHRRAGHVRSNGTKIDQSASGNDDDLFVFGYHCTIFRDDSKAEHVDLGRHLMPLTYDPSTTIDRYDCRLLLSNVPEISCSPKSLSLEEQEMEYLCDEERYRDLRDIESASTSVGAAIPYDYDSTSDSQDNSAVTNGENSSGSDDDDLFAPSPLLKVPADMVTPSSFVQNTVIEKTALFVAQKGPQMEIIVNAKQKSNKRFRFLDFDNPLHKYYKHVLKMVREKRYTPNFDNLPPKKEKKKVPEVVKNENLSDEDSDDEGGDYMHPSFFSSSKASASTVAPIETSKPEVTLPDIDYKIGHEKDVYSALYNRLSAFIPKKEEKESTPDMGTTLEPSDPGAAPIPPPPDVQPVVDRLALYVARNGPEFENMVRSGGDERFKFVNAGHAYHPYYQSRLQYYQYEIYMAYVGQTFMAALNETTSGSSTPQNAVVSTCSTSTIIATSSSSPIATVAEIIDSPNTVVEMKPYNKPVGTSISFTFNKPKEKQTQENDAKDSNEIATDDLLIEKLNQDAPDDKADELLKEERRRKARLFLNMLKKNKTATNGADNLPADSPKDPTKDDTASSPSAPKVKKRRFDVLYKV